MNILLFPAFLQSARVDTNATAIVDDTNGVASDVSVVVDIVDCSNGYWKSFTEEECNEYSPYDVSVAEELDECLFTCQWCNVGTYTITSRECKVCPDFGFICRGGNNITIRPNWYVIEETGDFDTNVTGVDVTALNGRLAKRIQECFWYCSAHNK